MSALPPKTRSSADSAKIVDVLPAPVGQPSSEIYDQDEYYPPNNWARIRLAASVMYYVSDAHVMSQRDHTRACR